MKEQEQVSSDVRIFTLPNLVFRLIFPLLFVLAILIWCGILLQCLDDKMVYSLLCICLCNVFSLSALCGGFSIGITKAIKCCYSVRSTSYKPLVYFILLIILLESTTSKMSRSSSTYSRRLINNMMVDAFQLEGSINNSNVSLHIKEETSNVIPGKNLLKIL